MADYTLINARPSPYGRKVAVALLEKKIPFDVRYDVPWGPETCTPEFSPLEQLPILITKSGQNIYDSSYILEWLELRHPQPPLLPEFVDQILHAKLLQTLGERLMEIAQNLLFELQRPDPSKAWIERQCRKIRGGLDELDRLIGDRRVESHEPITLGDIAVGTTLLIWEFMVQAGFSPDHEVFRWRNKHHNLNKFVALLEKRPSFGNTRPETMEISIKDVQ